MQLVAIPDVDGDSLSIVDMNFPPESYLKLNTVKDFDVYCFEDLVNMIISFNRPVE